VRIERVKEERSGSSMKDEHGESRGHESRFCRQEHPVQWEPFENMC
jgi:hypothetical protein